MHTRCTALRHRATSSVRTNEDISGIHSGWGEQGDRGRKGEQGSSGPLLRADIPGWNPRANLHCYGTGSEAAHHTVAVRRWNNDAINNSITDPRIIFGSFVNATGANMCRRPFTAASLYLRATVAFTEESRLSQELYYLELLPRFRPSLFALKTARL